MNVARFNECFVPEIDMLRMTCAALLFAVLPVTAADDFCSVLREALDHVAADFEPIREGLEALEPPQQSIWPSTLNLPNSDGCQVFRNGTQPAAWTCLFMAGDELAPLESAHGRLVAKTAECLDASRWARFKTNAFVRGELWGNRSTGTGVGVLVVARDGNDEAMSSADAYELVVRVQVIPR